MSIKSNQAAGFTLVELMIATALGVMAAAVIVALMFFSSRSYVAMTNYTDMAQRSQLALDKMSKEMRQARNLTAYSPTSVTFQDVDGGTFGFKYDPDGRTLVRVSNGRTNTYLTECDELQFSIFQHTVKSNKFECYEPAYLSSARVVQMSWRCSRKILGAKATTENVQSAQVALRNH